MSSDHGVPEEPGSAKDSSGRELEGAQRIADAEHRIAEGERTIAGAEDRIAEAERSIAGTQDEMASNPRSVGADAEQTSGVDEWAADRLEARARRARSAEPLQTEEVLDRLEVAEQRDQAATSRDRAAEARDAAADARDRRAPSRGLAPAVAAREKAAADRGHSGGDRAQSGNDRRETRIDREALKGALTEAHMDELTGTFQRGMGFAALQAELDRATRADTVLTLAFVDVDNLKLRNDRDGHAAGDELLRNVAASMTANLRSYDPIVRYGGDEFICALADADLKAAHGRFSDISATLRSLDDAASISVGFAVFTPGETLGELTARGDADLYKAKRQRNQRG